MSPDSKLQTIFLYLQFIIFASYTHPLFRGFSYQKWGIIINFWEIIPMYKQGR